MMLKCSAPLRLQRPGSHKTQIGARRPLLQISSRANSTVQSSSTTANTRSNKQSSKKQRSISSSKAALGLAPLLLRASDAAAEGLAGAPDSPSGVSIAEIVLLLAPILLYGGFSVYRAKVNPRAKLSDFLFIAAAVVIVGNVLSILIFKVRLY